MAEDAGHNSGQQLSPGLTWADYLDFLVSERGSLSAIALELCGLAGTPEDSASIERALRRLRQKGSKGGGEYGQRLLRRYGLPKKIEDWTRWMGVYHSRFTDLPLGMCLDQLRVWNRPPVSESPARVWIQLGFVTCALRTRDDDAAARALQQAKLVGTAPAAAQIEIALVETFIDRRSGKKVDHRLAQIEPLLEAPELSAVDRACFRARWLDQKAYQLLHAEQPRLEPAKNLYQSIESDLPFAATKREAGLAYVHHQMGAREAALLHARAACRHAGDGGLMRLRIAALNLLAHILGAEDGALIRARAKELATLLEDEDLLRRIAK